MVVPAELADSPEVAAFRDAHNKSLEFMMEHSDQVLELAASEMNIPLPVVRRIAEKYSFPPEIRKTFAYPQRLSTFCMEKV